MLLFLLMLNSKEESLLMKNKIVHLVTPYLFHTGSWIYSQIKGVRELEHFVFTQRRENIDQFPLENVFSIEDQHYLKQLINKINRKFFDEYGLFFKKYIHQIKPDLFHAHMGFEAVRWLNFIKKIKLPLVTTFYGQDVSKLGKIPYWLNKYQDLFEYGALFLAEGPYLKQQLVNLGCPEEKVVVQKLGVNIENYPPKQYLEKTPNSKFVILQVSTFREKKGIEYSLEAISKLRENNYSIEFRLIGAGDSLEVEQKLVDLAKKLGIEDNVKFLGKKSHRETIEEMTKSDIFLHPSVTAEDGDNEGGSPVGITEAAAVGLPVISTLHADIPSVVINGVSGFLVEERNSKFLAEKIEFLINNSSILKDFGNSARNHIINNFNQSLLIKSLENIYNRTIEKKN